MATQAKNAFIEALHYGIPCLAYNNTVFPEFLMMGFYVILAEDGDVKDLTEKLALMVINIEEYTLASVKNKKLAEDYFNIRRELEAWQEILV